MKLITAGVIFLISIAALAQPVAQPATPKAYISDRLNLGLYAQPDATATPIKSLPSGMQVEILETRDAFVRIRMVDGSDGWARAEFVTTEAPAKVLLQQVTRERDQLREQLNAQAGEQQDYRVFATQLNQARQKIQQLEQQLANPESSGESSEEIHIRYQRAQQTIEELQQQLDQHKSGRKPGNVATKVLWLLLTMLLSVGLGAVLGARWLGTRVRRRFNGLKVW